MRNLSFKQIKEVVSVIDVARYLGYRFDREKGTKQPSYVLGDPQTEGYDRIYIKNPNHSELQGYWRRGSDEKGDVIDFVRENLSKFPINAAYNDLDKLNQVLHNFANHHFSPPMEDDTYKKLFDAKPFEPERWIKQDNNYYRDRLLESRGIDRYSSSVFAPHIDLIRDRDANNKYLNLGFPYKRPGDDKILGYEIRGVSGYKSKASGTDSTNGMWIADFTHSPLEVRNVYVAESALDAISYYQINKNQIDLYSSVFVSFGGSFSESQFRGLMEHYNMANTNLLFDNDLYGNIYDIKAYAISVGKKLFISANNKDNQVKISMDGNSFSLQAEEVSLNAVLDHTRQRIENNMLTVLKPRENVKDWNEILQLEAQNAPKQSLSR